MEYEVEESVKLDEGTHEGVITGIEYRNVPYKYVDLIIECGGVKVKASYPRFVAADSRLGLLFARFGFPVAVGGKLSDEVLVGRRVSFMSVNKVSKKNGKEYPEVLPDTVKPLQEQIQPIQ